MDTPPELRWDGLHCLSGARAKPGGLHWGHAYGALAEVRLPSIQAFFFVVTDTTSVSKDRSLDAIGIARDFLAWTGTSEKVHVLLESEIRSALDPIVIEIERLVPRSWLEGAHPHRAKISDGTFQGTIGDYSFPVHQAAFTLGLGVERVCFNDDNAFVTTFARRSGRRISRDRGQLAEPRLLDRFPSNLIGGNGLRMCKANKNTVSLFADRDAIRKYVGRIVGLGVGSGNPEGSTASAAELGLAQLCGISSSICSEPDARERTAILTTGMTALSESAAHLRDSLDADAVRDCLTSGAETARVRILEVIKRWKA